MAKRKKKTKREMPGAGVTLRRHGGTIAAKTAVVAVGGGALGFVAADKLGIDSRYAAAGGAAVGATAGFTVGYLDARSADGAQFRAEEETRELLDEAGFEIEEGADAQSVANQLEKLLSKANRLAENLDSEEEDEEEDDETPKVRKRRVVKKANRVHA